MTEFSNPCGGVGWRTLSNGQIEVKGQGTPTASGAFATYVANSWRNFSPEILAAAQKRNVPVSWILALISVETGLWSSTREKQASMSSYCCVGPAAIMLSNYWIGGLSSQQELWDPAKNIDTGAAIMRKSMDKGYDLPAVAAAYKCGHVCSPNAPATPTKPGGAVHNDFLLCSAAIAGVSYPMMAILANNYAIASGLVPATGGINWKMLGIGLGIVGVGAAAAIAILPQSTLARYGL